MRLGEPEDVEGQCNARLYCADNFGDNHITFRCRRQPEHGGHHTEDFGRGIVIWEKDERE